MEAIRSTLEGARGAGRGVVLHVGGGSLPLMVDELTADAVIGHDRSHGRIVVRLDRIDAVSTA